MVLGTLAIYMKALGLNGLGWVEQASNNQLSFAVDVAVSHVLLGREPVRCPQWLDPEGILIIVISSLPSNI